MIWLLKKTIILLKLAVKSLENLYWKYIRNPNIIRLSCGPGYRDQDFKILYANFDIFMTLMREYAHHQRWIVQEKEKRKMSNLEFYRRNNELILEYLNWGATLDQPHNPDYMHNHREAEAYRTKMELYLWWTLTRPRREDPMELYINNSQRNHEESYQLEDQYYEEDTRMLKKLMDIRGSLWI